MTSRRASPFLAFACLCSAVALSATPPPPAPAPAPPPVDTSLNNCYANGSTLSACAASWEHMKEIGDKIESVKAAWESSGFANYVSAIAFLNQDTSWCDAAGTLDNQAILSAVAKFIRENPDKSSMPAAVLANTALKSSFPCAKKGAH